MHYDAVGAAYDQANHVEVCRGFHRAILPLRKRLAGETILDLGCGTGLLTERLTTWRCRVVGVDNSGRMLRVARQRCKRFGPRVRFLNGDLRTFRCVPPARAAFMCADIVNHFASEAQLLRLFRNVRAQLQPGGIFVCDSLNRWCFENYWRDKTYYLAGRDGDLVMECDWDPARRLGTVQMISYVAQPGGRYVRRRGVLRERFYDDRTLRQLFLRAGFRRVSGRPWSPWPDQHLEESVDRVLWTAVC